VKVVSAEHDLAIFETGESGPNLRAVMVTACLASRIMLMLDKAPKPDYCEGL
jgi:hypothetical protein